MAFNIKTTVINALMIEEIKKIEVIGFEVFLNKGPIKATRPPRMIDIRYLGYLATLEKNSPIISTNRILFSLSS